VRSWQIETSQASKSVYYNSFDVNAPKGAQNMAYTTFYGRLAVHIRNDLLRLTILTLGGHIAEIQDLETGVNPLWIPPWIQEPGAEFGDNAESRLLQGIMGHNVCVDLFGPPSDAEGAAGMTAHAEASIEPYEFEESGEELICRCELTGSQLSFERRLRLDGRKVLVQETVRNNSVFDRPIAWTEHVTLGPPFLESGKTLFRAPIVKSAPFGGSVPIPLEVYGCTTPLGGFNTHLTDPAVERAWFTAWSPASNVALGYVWDRADFPWLGAWEENQSRTLPPWNGRTQTRGMEFSASPFPESRRQMIERGRFFDTPCYRWIDAKGALSVRYYAAIAPARSIPSTLTEFEGLL
jgi:hypothetical protein